MIIQINSYIYPCKLVQRLFGGMIKHRYCPADKYHCKKRTYTDSDYFMRKHQTYNTGKADTDDIRKIFD